MLQSCWQISSKVILLPIRCVICIFINKQVDIYSLAKLQWVILQADNVGIKGLKIGTNLGNATLMLCGAVICEFTYLIFDVTINLYQGWTNKFFSEPTMKMFIGFQWILWFAKALAIIGGYVFILLSLI